MSMVSLMSLMPAFPYVLDIHGNLCFPNVSSVSGTNDTCGIHKLLIKFYATYCRK